MKIEPITHLLIEELESLKPIAVPDGAEIPQRIVHASLRANDPVERPGTMPVRKTVRHDGSRTAPMRC